MNGSRLVWTSLLIALLLHLIIFNFTTIVFPIGQDSLKPKFFFLGPILSNSDVQYNLVPAMPVLQETPKNVGRLPNQDLKSLGVQEGERAENPFSVQAVQKPLISHSEKFEDKRNLKSTFEISPPVGAGTGKTAAPKEEFKLNIPSYKPLTSPSSEHAQD